MNTYTCTYTYTWYTHMHCNCRLPFQQQTWALMRLQPSKCIILSIHWRAAQKHTMILPIHWKTPQIINFFPISASHCNITFLKCGRMSPCHGIVQQCFLCDANAQHIHNPLNMCCCMHDDGWSSLQTAQLHFTRHIYNPINMRCCMPWVLELQIIALPYLSAIGLGCTDDL